MCIYCVLYLTLLELHLGSNQLLAAGTKEEIFLCCSLIGDLCKLSNLVVSNCRLNFKVLSHLTNILRAKHRWMKMFFFDFNQLSTDEMLNLQQEANKFCDNFPYDRLTPGTKVLTKLECNIM